MYSKKKSLNFGNYVPNDKVLNKKIPENPRYKHVKPAVDTGKNVRKHIDELKEKQKNCNHKKDEVFKRIKISAFIKLALAIARDILSKESDVGDQAGSNDMLKVPERLERKGIANVLMGIGELDLMGEKKKTHSAPVKPGLQMPYLLLDVRDADAFSQCHIITAKHYPSIMLSRSIGYETEDLKLFKNYPLHFIILYDEDEVISPRVATTLVERGYENVYVLTGGLKLALEVCPHGLTTSSQKLTPVHMLTHGASSHLQRHTGKEYFSQEDIDIIQNYVDAYPTRCSNLSWSSKSSQSRKDKSVGSFQRMCAFDNMTTPSRTSTTSRRESTCSSFSTEPIHLQSASSKSSRYTHSRPTCSKNIEQTHIKSAIGEKSRMPKKAPWK